MLALSIKLVMIDDESEDVPTMTGSVFHSMKQTTFIIAHTSPGRPICNLIADTSSAGSYELGQIPAAVDAHRNASGIISNAKLTCANSIQT